MPPAHSLELAPFCRAGSALRSPHASRSDYFGDTNIDVDADAYNTAGLILAGVAVVLVLAIAAREIWQRRLSRTTGDDVTAYTQYPASRGGSTTRKARHERIRSSVARIASLARLREIIAQLQVDVEEMYLDSDEDRVLPPYKSYSARST